MDVIQGMAPQPTDAYYGRILSGDYSEVLKSRIELCIRRCRAFDDLGTPAIPYISAWQSKDNNVWYEFVSRRLLDLLGCGYADAARHFKNSVLERRRYIKPVTRYGISEEVLSRNEVDGKKLELREDVISRGTLEAVYKIRTGADNSAWIKDQAALEVYKPDGVFVSLGNLTIVTKEMEAEELLKEVQLSLKRSEKKYRRLAIHDNLTGLYNTRFLYQSLTGLIKRSVADARRFSLVFMDIDNFKQVVDANGHLNASRTLQEIAVTIKTNLPAPAYGVAYGGDEFVLVLPGLDKQRALSLTEVIRRRIKETVYLRDAGLNVQVSASFGIATFPDDAQTLSDLLALADQAMFSVKKSGKDSICGISYHADDFREEKVIRYDLLR